MELKFSVLSLRFEILFVGIEQEISVHLALITTL